MKASNVSIAVPSNSSDDQPDDSNAGGSPPYENPFLPPVYPKPGVLHSTTGCSKMSQSPSFGISKFYWSEGGISFSLKNNALNYTQRCSISLISSSAEERLQNPTWWNCTRFDPMHSTYPASGIYTTLLYGGPKNILGINQTWYCDDEDVSKP